MLKLFNPLSLSHTRIQSFIKEEPEDITSDIDEMDPTQFLAQENDDEMETDEHPPILASLGLTHISHVRFLHILKFNTLFFNGF